ncbi:hypothetical protein SLA2020_111700 [Shorea laevis]
MRGPKSQVFFLLCVLTLISFPTSMSSSFCYPTGNFTGNDTYARNRDLVLFDLASNTSRTGGFYTTSRGEDPDKVYALGLCRQDYDDISCSSCVNSTIQDVITSCPIQKEALSRRDCLIHYANRDFSEKLELSPSLSLTNVGDLTTNLTQFDQIWEGLMDNLVTRTIGRRFQKMQENLTHLETIYALMECVPDLSLPDCDFCLRKSVSDYQNCCHGKRGGAVLKPSCFFRWDLYPFYETSVTTPPSYVDPTSIAKKEYNQEVQLLELGGGNFDNDFSNKDFQCERMGRSQEFPSIQLDIINAATKHFSDANKLGEGGFGPVYKGTLADGKEIAVKRLSRSSHQGLLEFKNEVMLIAKLQHKNLVRLLGCCLESSEKLLVYEYMPNRSLDFFLFDSSMSVQLDWQRRFSIITGVARGIMYLHEDSRLKIIHRDLKASNILLDGEMNPKISDFGMARIFGGNQSEANTSRIVGTYGYMAPEYAMEGLFSVKSDVFSFGVLLLEIISGKKNNGFHLYKCGESLLTFAWKLWSTNQGMELIDPILLQSCVASEVLKCLHIGLLCVQEDPANRPTMSFVIVMLGSETITLPKPTKPAFSSGGRVVAEQALPPLNGILCSVNEVTLSNVSPR